MSTQIPTNTQQNTSININNSSSNILDILKSKYKQKNEIYTTLELTEGSIISLIGNDINYLNELTILAAAQNFSYYLKKNNNKGSIFISHDGSLEAIMFAKIFASALIEEKIQTYFNYENQPLNNAMAIYAAQKSKINFSYIVTFSNHIQKNMHYISFFDKKGSLLNSQKSKEINALISETNFLNLKIPNNNVPTISEKNLSTKYFEEITKNTSDWSNLDILISNPFNINSQLLFDLFKEHKANYDFVNWKKIPNKEKKITRKSLVSFKKHHKDVIINFNTDINNFEILVKHKRRWKYLTLNDLSILYIYYEKLMKEKIQDKEIFCSNLASKYIEYYANINKVSINSYNLLSEYDEKKIQNNILLATNGNNYFVSKHNTSLCSDPIINIKIFLNLIAYFKKANKNLYQVLSEIYQSNGIFYFNSKKEKIDIESANTFFYKVKNLKEINNLKVVKINHCEESLMSLELVLEDKTIINLEYSRNINQLVSNISVWNQEAATKTAEDDFMNLIVKEKKIMSELNSLKETFDVKKISWYGFLKYAILVALFISLIILMFTFVLGGDTGLWNNVLAFLQNQKDFSYLLPFFILIILIYVLLYCLIDKWLFKKLNQKVKLRHLWISNMISICISAITPLIYGGESVSYWYLRRKKIDGPSIAAIFLIKSLFTQINFIVFSLIFMPIGFVSFYGHILNQEQGPFIIVLVIIGTILDGFAAIMISLLAFSSRLTSFLAKKINHLIEWIPFIVSKSSLERGSQLKYQFTNINIASKKIFYYNKPYKNFLIFLETLALYFAIKVIDLGVICALIGNFLQGDWLTASIKMLSGSTMVRSINALNLVIPSGIGISDWATKEILGSMFKANNGGAPFYSVEVFQTLSRIIFTFGVVILSASMLLTIFIGESRIDKYNKIKKTLTPEEIAQGKIKITTTFYSFAIIPWILGIITCIIVWYLILHFVIFV